jgi:predicted ATPase with chaperone activity
MKIIRKCSNKECEKEERQKNLKKVNGGWYCSKCYVEIRKKHRENTQAEIKEDLKKLNTKYRKEYENRNKEKLREYQRERYHKENPDAVRYKEPKVSGAKKKTKLQTNCYITLEEKRLLFSQLISHGLSFEDAKIRIRDLTNQLADLREEIKLKKKTQEEAITKQERLIQELYTIHSHY